MFMIRLLIALAGLCILPVFLMLFLKVLDRHFSFAGGYVCGTIFNLTVFSLYIRKMAKNMEEPGMAPVKIVLGAAAMEVLAFAAVVCVRCFKEKRWLGIGNLLYCRKMPDEYHKKKRFCPPVCAGTFIIWMAGAVSYLRYVPQGAVTMMADINRLDFFGITNSDPMVMLGYYLKKLCGISQADGICIVIPLSFYAAFVALMWEMADTLFKNNGLKRSLCFLTEGILVVAGDCLCSQPFIVMHGLNRLENALLVLCVPLTFAIGLRLLFCEEKFIRPENKVLSMPAYWLALLLCIVSTYLLEKRAFALIGLNVVIFVLLFAGRRYLPWLQSSKS